MKLFLVSDSLISIRDDNGIKIATRIDESNDFINNLKKFISKYDYFVFICNDPLAYEQNDTSAKKMALAFESQLNGFKHTVVLDDRTKANAKEILLSADFIFLQGGKIPVQNQFLKDIDFANIVKQTEAVVVGKSAGAMNMADKVYNYPEEDSEVDEARWYAGVGLCKFIVIPHFNLKNGNEYCFGNFNLLTDYYLPTSIDNKFYALTNGSYILIENGISKVFGESYIIQDGAVTKLCSNNESKFV